MYRRLMAAVAALALVLAGLTPAAVPDAQARGAVACDDYCGERAAARCEDVDSLRCGIYIASCLAGCNVRKW
ncbi:MAG: hypothetical protein RRA92_02210 [Gemmatimonadota bacterium]|nr:hypothetical protein [Gemmatimonadota bacterium]